MWPRHRVPENYHSGRQPPNQVLLLQQQRQKLMVQQQKVLQQQKNINQQRMAEQRKYNGLNSAIRDLQQRSSQHAPGRDGYGWDEGRNRRRVEHDYDDHDRYSYSSQHSHSSGPADSYGYGYEGSRESEWDDRSSYDGGESGFGDGHSDRTRGSSQSSYDVKRRDSKSKKRKRHSSKELGDGDSERKRKRHSVTAGQEDGEITDRVATSSSSRIDFEEGEISEGKEKKQKSHSKHTEEGEIVDRKDKKKSRHSDKPGFEDGEIPDGEGKKKKHSKKKDSGKRSRTKEREEKMDRPTLSERSFDSGYKTKGDKVKPGSDCDNYKTISDSRKGVDQKIFTAKTGRAWIIRQSYDSPYAAPYSKDLSVKDRKTMDHPSKSYDSPYASPHSKDHYNRDSHFNDRKGKDYPPKTGYERRSMDPPKGYDSRHSTPRSEERYGLEHPTKKGYEKWHATPPRDDKKMARDKRHTRPQSEDRKSLEHPAKKHYDSHPSSSRNLDCSEKRRLHGEERKLSDRPSLKDFDTWPIAKSEEKKNLDRPEKAKKLDSMRELPAQYSLDMQNVVEESTVPTKAPAKKKKKKAKKEHSESMKPASSSLMEQKDVVVSKFGKTIIDDSLSEGELSEPEIEPQEDKEEEEDTTVYITRSCPADLFFDRNSKTGNMDASQKMLQLEKKFQDDILARREAAVAAMPNLVLPEPPPITAHHHHHHHGCSGSKSSSSDSSSDSEDEDDDSGGSSHIIQEWERRKKHPLSLHPELWYNETGRINDGPLCRCSIKSRNSGVRHDIYPGEGPIPKCNMSSNNLDSLHHYRMTMSPSTNFLTKAPTLIEYDEHEYIFEGFSIFAHTPLDNIPPCKLLRFNIEYTIHFIPEKAPENFTVNSLDMFSDFVFKEILELLDLDWGDKNGGCRRFHVLPRFSRHLKDSGCKEVLSMNTVLNFLLKSAKPLVDRPKLKKLDWYSDEQCKAEFDSVRGMIVTKPGMKPSSLRIDQLDKGPVSDSHLQYPFIIHQGFRPAQMSYAGDPMYRKAWKQYVKFRHLLNSKPKITPGDKNRLKEMELKLQEICTNKTMKREVTVEQSCKGFLLTGLRSDLCQHALMVPVLMRHLRFHICLGVLEEQIGYKFKDRNLLQLALTHTSYRTNYGTNPDHTRTALTNCGMRFVEYGDRRVHYQNTRKRGICILLDIMSRFGKKEETVSEIPHNERLEFLGDAVIEFLTSVHLFFMFPWLEEGGLSTYRMALVQNHHLVELARKLHLEEYMLYVHGPDLCRESDLRHAMANCFEALMGALFLDGGLDVVDSIFGKTLFDDDNALLTTWTDLPKHVLQESEVKGDRHWVPNVPVLQKLEKFEESIGVKFDHIRLLAKAFTHRNIGDNPLTLGHNQRLEFLGDTVLQLVASEYLYRHYPEHHEGHLSLLRSSLVNSRTQAHVYDDLGMGEFVIFNEEAVTDGLDMKTKQRADMLEAVIGALYVDKGLDYCWVFCKVCFFPRLKEFITNQDWNDPKSQLQQCCLTLRVVGGGEPDIPVYKTIESIGPTNCRKYVVAVYFRNERLATGSGRTIQLAEMAAASAALEKQAELFPILNHQRSLKKRKVPFLKRGDIRIGMGRGAFNKIAAKKIGSKGQAAPTRKGPNQNGPNRNGPNQNGPNRNGPNQNGPNRNGPTHFVPNRNGFGRGRGRGRGRGSSFSLRGRQQPFTQRKSHPMSHDRPSRPDY